MKTIYFALFASVIFLHPSHSHALVMPEKCLDTWKAMGQERALEVACSTFDIAKKMLEGKETTVPAKVYHWGKKEHMLENAKEKNIPQKVWDEIIMGEKSRRYNIRPLRRGLYGTHGVDTNGFYEDWSNSGYSWLMEVSIKPDCRKPEKSVSLNALQNDFRFSNWIKKKTGSLPLSEEEFRATCSEAGDYITVYMTESCQVVAEAFLKDHDIKVIQDHIINKSFYIRDRNCIEDIKSFPADMLQVLATNPLLWVNSCGINYNSNSAKFLLNLLLDESLTTVDRETIQQLKVNLQMLHKADRYKAEYLVDAILNTGNLFAARKQYSENKNNLSPY